MPLLKRARIEIYLPERRAGNYMRLQSAFENEFLRTFGGCSVIKNIKGIYLGSDDAIDSEAVSLVYTDTPFALEDHLEEIEKYTDELRGVALEASNEESILIVVHEIFHSLTPRITANL